MPDSDRVAISVSIQLMKPRGRPSANYLRMIQRHRDQIAVLVEVPDQVRVADVADDGTLDQQLVDAVAVDRVHHRKGEGDLAELRRDRGDLARRELMRPAGGPLLNAHEADRRRNLHVADLAGDEGERTLEQREERVVRIALERIVVQRHARVGEEIERGAVGQRDGDGRAAAGLDHVVLVDGVARMQRHRHAVALDGDVACDLVDMADRIPPGVRRRVVGRVGRLRFGVFAGKQRDLIEGQSFAVRRHQRGMMRAREIAGNDDMLAVMTMQMQIDARPLKRARSAGPRQEH